MDEQKSNYSSNSVDHEINIGECSSEGEDEGEGDDEEELDEEVESVGDEESEEEVGDEEDETIDSVSLSSENFNGFKELEYRLDESSSQDVSENTDKSINDQESASQTKTVVASVISISPGETKFSVKLKRCQGPVKLCCLCNLGEQSQLGQGKFQKIKKPEFFVEEKLPETERVRSVEFPKVNVVTGKHRKSASRQNSSLHEPVDEHSMIGHVDKVTLSDLFDEEGFVYIHSNCALFSRQITYNDNSELENVIPCVSKSLTRICSHCNRYGASITCSFNNCNKTYHYPCSAASAGFQHLKTHSFICNAHIDHIPLLPTFNEVSCHMCFSLGDVSNLMMCSICGNHYHGICLGRALLPGVRTGWQCSECRSCQICHASEESSKIMLCEVCDKAYHSACLRPVITSIPKFGWKCQYCRICSDCGSRTPGSGFSSRWHRHFTVCDSCYQQRNKGFSCPLCHRAYRTGSSKEMAQCTACKKFVHRTCDPEADPVTYQKKIEAFPDYQYVCPTCKNMHQFGKITLKRKESFEDSSVDVSMNTSHESLTSDDMEVDLTSDKDDYKYSGGIGLGKGKPFTARKKMTFSAVRGFKSKYNGKAALCPPVYQKKNQKMVDFGRKKCTKTKMRGVFGAPGTGLQGPVTDSQTKSDRECDEKKILLSSTNDEFVLSQDMCVKCSALGTDQEGCLIACVQCGQCYHPYCADSNKVPKISKTMLERGWKCIKCAVCEGCGKCDNESVLILCDDCNIAYHTYCVEPKLDGVPEGSWKCKWCAHCLTCGANEPGVNSVWLKSYTECGPCASRVRCPSCHLLYSEGDLIIKCESCERWLHGVCDQIRTESDAEKCAIEGYSCLLCRPKDTPPPHLLIPPQTPPISTSSKFKIRPISPIKVAESVAKDETEHFVDGTCLSENGLSHLTTLLNRIDTNVFSLRKKKRNNNSEQGDQGILDSIESVIAGSEVPLSSSAITYRDGMVIEPREDGKPPEAPEGFNICTNESGVMILKKKRIRKIGVGGFNARIRTGKKDREEEEATSFYNDEANSSRSVMSSSDEKPRKKNRYRKPKSKYAESYPSYIQDAFFGRELLDTTKDVVQNLESGDSDSTEVLSSRKITNAETVTLSQDELKIMELVNAKREEMEEKARIREQEALKLAATKIKVENEEQEDKTDELTDNDNETFKDILNMSGNFLDTIMNEDNSRSTTNTTMINDVTIRNEVDVVNYDGNQKDEFTDILGPNFNIESIVHESGLPNMDGKDVEDIFKDVLTDDTQNSHESVLTHTSVNAVSSTTFPVNHTPMNVHPTMVNNMQPGVISQTPASIMSPSHSVIQGNLNMPPNRTAPSTPSQVLPSSQNISSPATYPATSPYHSEYSNSPSQFSPAFSEPPSPWVQEDTPVADSANVIAPSTSANQRTSQKMEVDECLGDKATISSVLYANSEHPELKSEFPVWSDRCKQILKKWRALPAEKKQPYLNQARENRTNMTRVRKSSKISKDETFATESNSSVEPESPSGNQLNNQFTNTTSSETMSKVRQEDLFHPLLSTLSTEKISSDSSNQAISVSSSPSQRSCTPDNQTTISNTSNVSPSFTNLEQLSNEVDHTSSVSMLNSNIHSDETDGTVSQQTVTTTIPSHPSTIQYIPIIQTPVSQSDSALNVRTVHLISTSVPNPSNSTQLENSTRTSTIRYQYVPAIQHNRNTIHYPPNNVQIIHSGSSLIMNSNSLITAALQSVTGCETTNSSGNKFLQLIPSSPALSNQVVRNIQVMSTASEEQCETGAETDQNIRVLTPSEIMKTLPSLGQESFDISSNTEQEKVAATQKVKESEQEKNWKQIQAIRQQQMHDPRIQTLQRIQQQSSAQQQQNQLRQMATNGADNSKIMFGGSPVVDNRTQLQIITSPDAMSSSMTSPGRPSQRFQSPIIKLPPPSPVNQTYQRVQGQDVFTPPRTPKPQFYPVSQNTPIQVNSPIRQRSPDNELYSVVNSNSEMNRQLRELLQKQQIESNQTDQQHGQTKIWVQDSSNQQQILTENNVIQNDQMNMPTSSNVQGQMFDNSQTANTLPQPFRPPFPPRSQRVPFQVTQQMLVRQRMPQQMDPRFRLLIQQQHQLLQQQQQRHQQMQQQQLLQQQQQLQQFHQQQQQLQQPSQQQIQVQQPSQQQMQAQQSPQQQMQAQQLPQQQMQAQQSPQQIQIAAPNQIMAPSASPSQPKSLHEAQLSEQAQNILTGNVALEENNGPVNEVTSVNKQSNSNLSNDRNDAQNEGLPESVTADLDELEKDGVVTGNISEIFGDLMEDELLAEMGAGFNILEYADPELDDLPKGENSNILYDFVNGASDSTKAKGDEKADDKSSSKESPPTGGKKDIQMQKVENSFNENNASAEKTQQQRVMQLQRTNLRNPNSPISGGNQLMQHVSPTDSQGSFQSHSAPLTPRPPSAVTPGTRSPLQAPSAPHSQDLIAQSPITGDISTQLSVVTQPAPPPPPYPCPPPPYPSQLKSQIPQQVHHMSESPAPNIVTVPGSQPGTKLMHHGQISTEMGQIRRRSLLLQEQPLLLEDLLEQEKREQEKQTGNNLCGALPPLSDADFERLRADVLNSSGINGSMQPMLSPQSQNIQPSLMSAGSPAHNNVKMQAGGNVYEVPQQQIWQQPPVPTNIQSNNVSSGQTSSSPRPEPVPRIPIFNAPKLQVPLKPPENIVTEQDRQMQQAYEQWLDQQNSIVTQQLKHYEGEIAKLRKTKKSLTSKQRMLKKQGNELTERDTAEFQKVSGEMSILQKYVDSSRKMYKQHTTLIQEYVKEHPNSAYASNNIGSPASTPTTPVPVNVVSSANTVIGEIPSNDMVTSTQQKVPVVVASTMSRVNPTNIITQTQPNEMQFVVSSNQQEIMPTAAQLPTVATSQIRPSFRSQEHVLRYPGGTPVRFVQSVRQPRPNVLTFQVPGEGGRQAGSYQNVRNTFKTQPFIVSAVSSPSSPSVSTVTSNLSPVFQNVSGQQLTPEQQQVLIQRQQSTAQRPVMSQQSNMDLNALSARQKRIFQQRQNLITQAQGIHQQITSANLSPKMKQTLMQQRDALIKQIKELQQHLQQVELVPQQQQQYITAQQRQQMLQHQQQQQHHQQQMQQKQNVGMNQALPSPQQQKHMPPQSPVNQQLNQLLNHSPESSQHQFNQPINSPIQPQSPQQFSQPLSNSSAPPHSPMYQSQPAPSPTGSATYSYMHSGPPSVPSHYNQPASPMPPQSPRHTSQFVHPSSSPAHPQSPYTSHDTENTGGGGGNPMSYVNAIPIPEEFRRLGIEPGLLGGSPAWTKTKKTKILAHEFEKYGIKGGLLGGTPTWNEKQEENNVEKVKNEEKNATVEDVDIKPCSSKSSPPSSAQFFTVEEDVDSRDLSLFFSLPEKTIKKSPNAESSNIFENVEFQRCGTPKTLDDSMEIPVYKDVPLVDGCKSEEMNTSDDSIELPMYKDVRLLEGCKSEENSLCFPAAIEDNEISLPLDMDTSGLHLALDSGDVRSDDLLDDCLVSSDLLVLNVSEDQEIIEEIKYTPDTVTSTPLRTTSVVQSTTTINVANETPSSCEETNTISHSVISTHAFHSYAKIVKTENGEDFVDVNEGLEPEPEPETEIEFKQEPEPEPLLVPNERMETEISEVIEEPKPEQIELENIITSVETTKAIVASVVTTIPTRTTSVLQMTSAALAQSSTTPTTKEIPTTSAEPPPPVYSENFHSYVKKLPKTNEDDNFEKDKQLFDETLMKIKAENVVVEKGRKEQQTVDKKGDASTNACQSPPIAVATTTVATTTTVAQYQSANSVITKDTKLVSLAHSTSQNQPKESTVLVQSTPQQVTGTMFPPRVRPSDDSQNVLLKQLLQNSGSSNITHSTMTQHVTKPPPSPSYKSPPANTIVEVPATMTTTTVDTVIAQVSESQPKLESHVQFAPVQTAVPTTVIKQEMNVPLTSGCKEVTTIVSAMQTVTPSSTMSPMHIDIKKEIVPDELISPQSKTADVLDTPNSVSGDSSTGSVLDAQDLKKLKRRQYQAKRRQSQSKDNAAVPKKRNRRVSKVDEDYDTFVDGLMTRIRQLPRIEITEPLLIHNYAACLPYGAGDGTKISLKTWVNGELVGTYESFRLPKRNDYYNTEPFGDDEPIPQPAVSPPTNDFYNVELPPLNLEADYEERRLELARMDRELDTPDSVISSSSPECIIPHTPSRFAGLRLIDENGSGVDSEEDEKLLRRISPVIPLVVPLALRPRIQHQNDAFIQDKENYGKSTTFSLKSRNQSCIPLKDKANLSVTLTFNSRAAQDIVGVLKNLATVLNIAPPVTYKVSDRISTPNKINPFANKINDDIEEVELEKYLSGSTKYCQHCKTPINIYTSVKKKASEVPFLVQDGVSDDLLFCSTSCYLQMILLVPPVISEHKVSSSDDHVPEPSPRKKMRLERSNDADVSEVSQVFKVTDANSGKDISYVEKTSLTPESTTKSDHTTDKKQLKGVKYRTWSIDSIPPPIQKYKTPTEKEITETLFRMKITVMPKEMPDDMRSCMFCQQSGDGVANGPSRLLNYDVDKWAHLNCSLWSDGVYETQNGALMNVDAALKTGVDVTCTYCKRNGATLKCFKLRCSKVYHLSCAMKSGCCFLENKSVFCEEHLSKAEINRVLTTLAVYRRVYIDRDENRQIASVIKHAELTHLMRIGSLIFLNVGQLLPHQLQEFHTPNFIYPVGYKVIRFYWSMRVFNKRCQYVCSIHDVAGRPEFRILIQEQDEDDLELRGSSPNAVWTRILEPLAKLRKSNQSVQLFPCYVTGDYLFGLTEPAIVRILENLPGIETLGDYTFKFGRDPLLELPLAVNPSGCARCEPRVRGPPLKRTHTQRTSSVMPRPVLTSSPLFSGDLSCPYSKHFVHSKSSQYKKMKQEWRNHVYLARSKIQGLGLYAARDIDKHTMVIEYIGEIIRSQLSDFREKQYEAKNRGVYMFRLDENRVVDATISGGLARYINHSCNPNCITEKVEVDREYRIIIFSKRRIVRGEELSYDYQFDIEDDMHKIPCLCGAPNCRKWMN